MILATTRASAIIIVFAVALAAANFFFAQRDGLFTPNVNDYSTTRLVGANDFEDHPMQTIYTYFNREAQFLNPGIEGFELPFADRLQMYFGENLGEQSILDVRKTFSEEELFALRLDIDLSSFASTVSCPHDESMSCKIAVNWDRSMSKSPNVSFVTIRYGDTDYAILDTSFLTSGDK